MSVQRWRRKPVKQVEDVTVARYEPGRDLADLTWVATLADSDAELAEVKFPSGRRLVVKWFRPGEEHPGGVEYEVIEAGALLAYSHGGGFLFSTDDRDLRHWYDRLPADHGGVSGEVPF